MNVIWKIIIIMSQINYIFLYIDASDWGVTIKRIAHRKMWQIIKKFRPPNLWYSKGYDHIFKLTKVQFLDYHILFVFEVYSMSCV